MTRPIRVVVLLDLSAFKETKIQKVESSISKANYIETGISQMEKPFVFCLFPYLDLVVS